MGEGARQEKACQRRPNGRLELADEQANRLAAGDTAGDKSLASGGVKRSRACQSAAKLRPRLGGRAKRVARNGRRQAGRRVL